MDCATFKKSICEKKKRNTELIHSKNKLVSHLPLNAFTVINLIHTVSRFLSPSIGPLYFCPTCDPVFAQEIQHGWALNLGSLCGWIWVNFWSLCLPCITAQIFTITTFTSPGMELVTYFLKCQALECTTGIWNYLIPHCDSRPHISLEIENIKCFIRETGQLFENSLVLG